MVRSNFLTLILLIAAFGLTLIIRMNLVSRDERVLPPPQGMEYTHFGFNEVISDFLWLSYIQQVWNCHQSKQCYQNWGFRVLDEASTLAPKFKSLYIYGATGLSILLDDDYGAKEIFDRGLVNYPDDWVLNYRAGYHYLIELGDEETAARLLNIAGDNGAQFWTKSLSARLYERSGNLDLSEEMIQTMILSSSSDEWIKSLNDRLFEIQRKKAILKAKKIKDLEEKK
jgi:hypothetical protein